MLRANPQDAELRLTSEGVTAAATALGQDTRFLPHGVGGGKVCREHELPLASQAIKPQVTDAALQTLRVHLTFGTEPLTGGHFTGF